MEDEEMGSDVLSSTINQS